MSSIIDVLKRADEMIGEILRNFTVEDVDREIKDLDRWRNHLVQIRDKMIARKDAQPPKSNGKPASPTYSHARLPVPVSTPAVLPVPGLTMPAPEEETPSPEPARANGCRQPPRVSADKRRADVVRFILRNGPATMRELQQRLDIPAGVDGGSAGPRVVRAGRREGQRHE